MYMKMEVFLATAKRNIEALSLLHEKHRVEMEEVCRKQRNEVNALSFSTAWNKVIERWVKRYLGRDITDNAAWGSNQIMLEERGVCVVLESDSWFDYESVVIPYAAFSTIKARRIFIQAFKAGFLK
jgi:hypothetical protein